MEAVADRLLAEGDIGTTKFVAKAVKERGTFIARSDIDKIYTKGVNDLAREITAIIESTLDHNPLTEYRRGYNDALNDLLKILPFYIYTEKTISPPIKRLTAISLLILPICQRLFPPAIFAFLAVDLTRFLSCFQQTPQP